MSVLASAKSVNNLRPPPVQVMQGHGKSFPSHYSVRIGSQVSQAVEEKKKLFQALPSSTKLYHHKRLLYEDSTLR